MNCGIFREAGTSNQADIFISHLTLLLTVFRYGLSYIFFNYYSRWAKISYRLAFVSAAATYGIVVYKQYIARGKLSGSPVQIAFKLLSDENVQYLGKKHFSPPLTRYPSRSLHLNFFRPCLHIIGMALVWLYSRQVPLALLPFSVYSVFHVATYTRTYLLPTLQPSPQGSAAPASPGGSRPAPKQSPLADSIGKFVKQYYDSSMYLVASLELGLLFRLVLSALTFSKGSWVLLVIYLAFFRARYSQSSFVQSAVARFTARVDTLVSHQSTPPQVRQGWESFKGVTGQVYGATDIKRYLGGEPAAAGKKPQ
jgi:transmembrane protein 33